MSIYGIKISFDATQHTLNRLDDVSSCLLSYLMSASLNVVVCLTLQIKLCLINLKGKLDIATKKARLISPRRSKIDLLLYKSCDVI